MNFCAPHWEKLKQAIRERGLWPLVSPSAEVAHEATLQEIQHGPSKETFDPLLNATWAIYGRALECGGIYLMTGDYCPLCELDKHIDQVKHPTPAPYTTPSDAWIGGCCDAQLTHARELGLVAPTQ